MLFEIKKLFDRKCSFCGRDDCSVQMEAVPITVINLLLDLFCSVESSCSQKCTNFAGGYYCACEPGYSRSGKTCKALTRQFAKIYITNGSNLIISNIERTVLTSVRKSSLMQSVTAFDFHNRTGRIFWANPRGVVLDPRSEHRLIFCTDWGKYPRIERASIDGTNRTVLISTKLYWPNGLAIDMVRERIYFADAHLDYIESCDYNGNNRVQVISNDLMLHHPHSLAFFEHNIFWLDRGHNKVLKLDRLSPKNKTTIADI
ncbi:low-density lipo receptor-related 2 [Brachionus plicatilis]|uniref:Low-density lipo receptor-related 2 n=1 Tax=Brachionus plicatilis TaxID=10195 RepID=A0A3M7PYE9_BRAPC|nr:low-density lipo receptor-related 2 [Brachionus plicatilis]